MFTTLFVLEATLKVRWHGLCVVACGSYRVAYLSTGGGIGAVAYESGG